MITELRNNINTEIDILKEIYSLLKRMNTASPTEKKLFIEGITALKINLRTINNSIPDILSKISVAQPLPSRNLGAGKMQNITFKGNAKTVEVTLSAGEKERFLRELSFTDSVLSKIKKRETVKEEVQTFKETRFYVKVSNLFFLNLSRKIVNSGSLRFLTDDIKKSNLNILTESYLAVTLFSTLVAFFTSLTLTLFILFFNISSTAPFITLFQGGYFSRLIMIFWIPIFAVISTLLAFYFYPTLERDSLAKKIELELPFAVMYMNTISGIGVEPSKIFTAMGTSKEYPFIRREIGKILNQINVYGYDLVTTLNNASRNTPSVKFSSLLSGIATTLSSGGDLKDFFQNRTETLLLTYRIEREQYTKMAETFMDIYISVVIAAPMILLLLMIMLSGSKVIANFDPFQMTSIIIGIVGIVNILFIGFLHFKQPPY